jgi:dTDP-4-amino-4,6-dideoxygalactose transaminase
MNVSDLSLFGGKPAFSKPLHVGQLYLPTWEAFEAAFKGVFRRRYFTNHGPLVQELDKRFAEHIGVRHAISVTNGTVALMVAAKALDLRGEIIIPAFTFSATAQAMAWAGLNVVLCDVDPKTHTLTAPLVAPHISELTTAVLGVHTWGRACDPLRLQELCRDKGISLFFDAAHAIDCTHKGKKCGHFGDLETFSFHATKALSGCEGGCVVTNDDELADRVRTVRNFHVSQSFSKVPLRINGKMSEAQAAMVLMGIDMLPHVIQNNRQIYETYRSDIRLLRGLEFIDYAKGEDSNYQYACLSVDEQQTGLSRDLLLDILWAENVIARRYFHPGIHRIPPFSETHSPLADTFRVTDELCHSLIQLPISSEISISDCHRILEILRFCLEHSGEIRSREVLSPKRSLPTADKTETDRSIDKAG